MKDKKTGEIIEERTGKLEGEIEEVLKEVIEGVIEVPAGEEGVVFLRREVHSRRGVKSNKNSKFISAKKFCRAFDGFRKTLSTGSPVDPVLTLAEEIWQGAHRLDKEEYCDQRREKAETG